MKLLLSVFILACGMKPLYHPYGCSEGHWQCSCDTDRNCEWVYVCEE